MPRQGMLFYVEMSAMYTFEVTAATISTRESIGPKIATSESSLHPTPLLLLMRTPAIAPGEFGTATVVQ